MKRRPTTHELRHEYARRLIESGVDLATVSKRLGHTTGETQARYAETEAIRHSQKKSKV